MAIFSVAKQKEGNIAAVFISVEREGAFRLLKAGRRPIQPKTRRHESYEWDIYRRGGWICEGGNVGVGECCSSISCMYRKI